MKVKELIHELEKYPSQAIVQVEDATGWGRDIAEVGAALIEAEKGK